jgi:hypothetical protein
VWCLRATSAWDRWEEDASASMGHARKEKKCATSVIKDGQAESAILSLLKKQHKEKELYRRSKKMYLIKE